MNSGWTRRRVVTALGGCGATGLAWGGRLARGQGFRLIETPPAGAELIRLENRHLAFRMRSDASGEVLDKATGERWQMGRVAVEEPEAIDLGHAWPRSERAFHEGYPARFAGTRLDAQHVRFTMRDGLGRDRGTFTCAVALDGPWLEFKLGDIDDALPNLIFPPPWQSESLLVPRGVGQWIKKPLDKRYFWRVYGHLNQRWFGGLHGERGWIGVFGDGHQDAGVMAQELALAPGWTKSLGRWSGPLTVRYRCTSGGYVGAALAFRAWAIEHGLHRPLTDKLRRCPALANLHGGRILSIHESLASTPAFSEVRLRPVDRTDQPHLEVWHTHKDAKRLLALARTQGLKRGVAVVRGWIPGGYDYSHPDVWPPERALGTVDDLRDLCRVADPLTVALHDNYMDMYAQSPSFPRGINRTRSGELMAGGFWAGGQAYIVSARAALAYAQRNWDQMKTLGLRAMFVDTTTATMLYESFEPGNLQSRALDQQGKEALLGFFKAKGLALGSEEGVDFGVPWVDWNENRHARVAGESVPLWPLVFHDAVFCARYADHGQLPPPQAAGPRWLVDLLWGYALLTSPSRSPDGVWPADAFGASNVVDDWHARVGLSAMTSHRYLTEDDAVEETQFQSGHAVVVNFAAEPRQVEGKVIPPGGYVFR